MALSANRTDFVISQDEKGGRLAIEVKNASVVYHGALCSCDTDTGPAKPFDGTETDKLLGWHNGDAVTGSTSTSPPPRASLITGPFMWEKLTLAAGLAGTNADIGKRIWATDDGTYTAQDPGSTGAEVGLVSHYRSATQCDAWMFARIGHVDSLEPLPTPTPTPTPTP